MSRIFAWLGRKTDWLLLTALTLLALGPLFASGYFFDAHDGRHSVFYLVQFDASLRDGALWPRWAMHHIQGYGYPTFILQAPLGFYLAEFFVLLGAGYTLAVKCAWVVGFVVSGWGMAALVRYWLDRSSETPRPQHRLAALAAGVLYVYIPYHLAQIYVRGALNDTLLFAWFPWVILAFDRLIDQGFAPGWRRRLVVAALTLGGALLTHSFALLSFTPLLMLFVLFRLALAETHQGRGLVSRTGLAAAAGLLALLLIATFLFPLLTEGPYLEQQVYISSTYDYRNHFVQWGQFFSPMWGFGFSDDPTGANDGMGFQIGVMALLLAMVAGYVTLCESEPAWLRRAYLGFLAVASFFLLFLMSPSSAALWQAMPMLAVIQFPWRLLSLTAFTVSALAGLVIPLLLDSLFEPVFGATPEASTAITRDAGAAVIILLIVLASAPYIRANLAPVEPWREDGRAVFRFEQAHPDMIAYTQWVQEPFKTSPMSAEYAADDYVEPWRAGSGDPSLTRLAILSGSGKILSHYSHGSSAGGVVRADTPATVRLHLYYFPGWRVTVDGQPVEHRVSDPHGLIEVDVPAGEHRIDAVMGATPARTAGTLTSWATLVLLVGLWFLPTRSTP